MIMKAEDQMPPESPSPTFEPDQIYTWAEVSMVHKVRIGILPAKRPLDFAAN